MDRIWAETSVFLFVDHNNQRTIRRKEVDPELTNHSIVLGFQRRRMLLIQIPIHKFLNIYFTNNEQSIFYALILTSAMIDHDFLQHLDLRRFVRLIKLHDLIDRTTLSNSLGQFLYSTGNPPRCHQSSNLYNLQNHLRTRNKT